MLHYYHDTCKNKVTSVFFVSYNYRPQKLHYRPQKLHYRPQKLHYYPDNPNVYADLALS